MKMDVKEKNARHYKKHKKKILEQKKEYQSRPEVRAKRIEYNRIYREKTKTRKRANKAVENAIKSGKMQRQPCEVCGEQDAQAHHPDYEKPLDVQWLCQPHHREAHAV